MIMNETNVAGEEGVSNFVRDVIRGDIASGKTGEVVTRFPPEPNGYLHIGHAKSICLNFGVATEFGGRCHLRFDDTNPVKEEIEYINAIQKDVNWLGFDWGEHLYFASDNFDKLYDFAAYLIVQGKAYVCNLGPDETREFRGTLTKPGKDSPRRNSPVDENLDLFARMKTGEFEDGRYVLRAKIDMASGNMNMRDPVLYRILNATHPRTGDTWHIYPTYDFAHGQSDAIEGVTHSICTLEFTDHRPLYDWCIEELPVPSQPHQYEFARLNLTYTVLSKRKLMQLVSQKHVNGWDDPRMPTISGLRRRGIPPQAIRDFTSRIGVTKNDSTVEVELFNHCVREYLNKVAQRRLGVLRPLKVIIDNYPEGQTEEVGAINNPENESSGRRMVPFSRELYIEQDDFMEDPPKKYFRLSPGKEVRFRYAYFITCNEVIKDDGGNVIELHCTYDPETKGGNSPDGRKVKGTIHWVSASHAVDADVNMYEHLFTRADPGAEGDFIEDINPNSLTTLTGCKLEPLLTDSAVGEAVQFERNGYFATDPISTPNQLVFNQAMALRDSWAKIQAKEKSGG
jgi:glutaminyl-tRNA synthetase